MRPSLNTTDAIAGSEVYDPMKIRVIAAVALLPLLLLVLLAAPPVVAAILVGLMAAIAAWELLRGTGLVKQPWPLVYCMIMAFMVSMWSYFGWGAVWAQLGLLIFFILLFGEMMISQMKLHIEKTAVCFMAGVLLPLLLTSIVRILIGNNGRFLVLVPFVMAFLSDTGAYFAGCAFGKHKLAPAISPKKTVEGVVGGVLGAVLGMVLYSVILDFFFAFEVNYLYAVIYGVLGSVGAVFGDLCFSVIKRQTGIKDYGNLIPGHGGILDRFDSMMVVGPLAEILLILLPLAV